MALFRQLVKWGAAKFLGGETSKITCYRRIGPAMLSLCSSLANIELQFILVDEIQNDRFSQGITNRNLKDVEPFRNVSKKS